MPRDRVCVEVSGGVDSAAATSLLIDQGHDCFGLYMVTCQAGLRAEAQARRVCEKLGIEITVVDLHDDFEALADYLCDSYLSGQTPNPCVMCNRTIKFNKVWEIAREMGATALATGQYVRKIQYHNQPAIAQGRDKRKDQSYVLAMVNRDIIPHLHFPMGDLTKADARSITASRGLDFSEQAESQEICFVPNDDYVAFLHNRRGRPDQTGQVVDIEGRVVGEHAGVYHYTIGQRRGLGIALHEPAYVIRLDAQANRVTLGPHEALMKRNLHASGCNWLLEGLGESFPALIKIRYNHSGQTGKVFRLDSDRVHVEFDEPVSAVTPGQAAVFYIHDNDNWILAGGGWIEGEP